MNRSRRLGPLPQIQDGPNMCAGSWWAGNTAHDTGPDPWTHGDNTRWCRNCASRIFGLIFQAATGPQTSDG